MPAPKPHDPRAPRVTPDEVDQRVADILREDADELEAEKDQLERAHAVLHDALQEN